MTVQEIYESVLALTLETSADNNDFEDFVIPHFNLLLQEIYPINNIARKVNGKESLPKAPRVYELTEDNPCEWQLDAALVYGLGAKLLTADESGLEGTYMQMYYAALDAALPVQIEEVVDCYAAYCD